MEPNLFAEVADIVRSMAPDGLGELRLRSHRRGVKVWFGPQAAPRVHYEAQLIRRRFIDDADGIALEIGFHSELKTETDNQAEIDRLLKKKRVWSKELGDVVTGGAFLGNDTWRRLSEVWIEPNLDDPDLAFEIGSRLVDYLDLFEPLRNEPSTPLS
ncbi:MAG: hypothetical protein HKN24_10990 [Acidimicrobiales bacterium]|nr:hypothetical protein [Acidimicrobiales bacterium]